MESLHWVMMAAWAVEAHWVHVGTGTKSDKINCLDYFSRMDARHGLVAEAFFKAPSAFFVGRGGGHRRPDLQAVPSHQGPGYGESEAGWL